MKASALRAMTADELMEELVRLRREQFDLRMRTATGQGGRSHRKGLVRRDIARVKTVLRELGNAERAS